MSCVVEFACLGTPSPSRSYRTRTARCLRRRLRRFCLEHLDYVLGPHVWGLNLGGEGRRRSPPWQVVLCYELALRREALRLVTFEGKNFRDAMFEARRCTELRDVHFIALALVSNVQSLAVPGKGSGDGGRAALRDAPFWPRCGPRGHGKNEDKGKGKAAARASSTPTSRRPRPTASIFASPTTSTNDVLTARPVGVNMSAASVLNHIPCTCATRTSTRPRPRAPKRWTWLVFAPRPAVRKGAAVVHQRLVCLQLP